ncbi:hypothetical protein CROQUDRAFT_136727 [Cronartium quercuum f. sp. fusiforme G11]|uniref:Uncharacterized protein n=1 Tax=Cronartium quercuum f. sp. fusiforme G11 TaxID=708437 RepID=A0A9P6T626_9BASI|nr:hypothetical protein CROQUDRAFT_136727 [Cronartium quercuum f. sp. fusiforme G11]
MPTYGKPVVMPGSLFSTNSTPMFSLPTVTQSEKKHMVPGLRQTYSPSEENVTSNQLLRQLMDREVKSQGRHESLMKEVIQIGSQQKDLAVKMEYLSNKICGTSHTLESIKTEIDGTGALMDAVAVNLDKDQQADMNHLIAAVSELDVTRDSVHVDLCPVLRIVKSLKQQVENLTTGIKSYREQSINREPENATKIKTPGCSIEEEEEIKSDVH